MTASNRVAETQSPMVAVLLRLGWQRRSACLLLLSIAALDGACARSPRPRIDAVEDDRTMVLINDRMVPVVAGNAYDLIWRAAGDSPLRTRTSADDDPPVVVMDGVLLGSSSILQDLNAFQISSIVVLSPRQAFRAYGPRARAGAIVVKSR